MVSTGQIIPTALHSEMQKSYLEYAMSVIVGRALPDVRDGLKPVHRRILYAMHELGLTPDRPYRKCARVVGDVLGKYHPHGDQAVYDALVRMVQDFSSRYPLLAGHGNFGSIDNDPPAAMRYTETRLASISHEAMLSEIGDATVEFIGNFDNSQQEPVVLPAQLPILLLNGCTGIAVGMATNIPPHNLGEIIDGLIALIDRPTLPDEKLFELIPGPDFPTGGEIVGSEGIRDAYSTGKGSITMRGVARIEEIPGSKGRHRRTAIVVTELPFQVNKAAWIEKVAQLVNQGNLEGVADLRDESDREGIRVVVELKREANPQSVLAHLYQQTALQSNFGVILLALVNSQPRQLSLRQVLEQFLEFREQTLNRRYTYELDKAQKRIHIVAGLIEALSNLDALIELLRRAPDGSSAKIQLQNRYNMSEAQADAILAMPLRRLTNLERQSLQAEYQELSEKIAELQKLLSDRSELLKALKKELRALKRKYADVRRTRIHQSLTSPKNSRITTETSKNTKTSTTSKDGNKNGNTDTKNTEKLPLLEPETKPEKGKSKSKNKTEPEKSTTTKTPAKSAKSKSSLEEIETNQSAAPIQSIGTQLSLLEEEETRLEFTQKGYGRRQTINNEKNKDRRSGKKTKSQNGSFEDDIIIESQIVKANQDILLITKTGKAYPVKVRNIPITPPQKRGTPLISLLPNSAQSEGQNIIAQFILSENLETAQMVMLTKQGRIKRLPFMELENLSSRGITLCKLKDDDELLYANITTSSQNLILATSGGRLLRMEVNQQQLPLMNRAAMANPAMALGKKEQIIAQVIVNAKENILLVSEQGYVKKIPVNVLRLSNRGDLGTQALQFNNKTDNLAAVVPAKSETKIVLLTNAQRLIYCDVDSLELQGKDSKGERLSQLQEGEIIISVVVSVGSDRE